MRNSDYGYFLASFGCHILLAGVVFAFIHASTSFNKKNFFTIANKGATVSVNIVNNANTPKNTIKQLNKEHKKPLDDYLKNDKAEVALNENNTNNSNTRVIKKKWGSGGEHGKDSEVIPVIKNDNLINYTAPEYPKRALLLREEGTVIVRLLVNTDGEIVVNKLYKSSGHRLLDNAVIKVAKLWSVNNPPIQTSWVEIVVNFIIR